MRYCQFLILEATCKCNLSGEHRKCPASNPKRYDRGRRKQRLCVRSMVKIAVAAYRQCGFRGYVGFHYYCEPMLALPDIEKTIAAVRREVPESRFMLWTNGTLITPDNAASLRVFEKIVVTNYDNRDFGFLKNQVPDTSVIKPQLDERLTLIGQDNDAPCVRPYTEFIVDNYGNVHLCCMDWRGAVQIGNVFHESLPTLAERFASIRDGIGGKAMSPDAPAACRRCAFKFKEISNYDVQIGREAKAHSHGVVARRPTPAKPTSPEDQYETSEEAKLFRRNTNGLKAVVPGRRAVHLFPDRPRRPLPFYAIINSWMEADIIEATVKNCFMQGCDKVYLLDNDSPDDTQKAAVAAGAILAGNYKTDFFSNSTKYKLINDFIGSTAKSNRNGAWWLALDSDELPVGPHGTAIREYLDTLPPEINVVGAFAFDHYPSSEPANIPGFHPADLQPYGMYRYAKFCSMRHWKHPLFLVDAERTLSTWRGSHSVWSKIVDVPITEPEESLLIHHFMYRNRKDTEGRLRALCESQDRLGGRYRSQTDDEHIGPQGSTKRLRNLDYVYSMQWDKMEVPHSQMLPFKVGAPVDHWMKIIAPLDYQYPRWYEHSQLTEALKQYDSTAHQTVRV